jgi:hypothetical protein
MARFLKELVTYNLTVVNGAGLIEGSMKTAV